MSYYDRDRSAAQGGTTHPRSHHGNTAEYQASGFPFVYQHGSDMADQRIEFPFVTQWICVTCPGGDVTIAFKSSQSDNTGQAMRFLIPQDSMMTLHIRCVDLWVDSGGRSDVTIMAGLTGVPRAQFPDITGLEGVDHVYTATGTNDSSKVTPS